jgi:hypothetical protein
MGDVKSALAYNLADKVAKEHANHASFVGYLLV